MKLRLIILFLFLSLIDKAQSSIDYDKVKSFNIVVNTENYTVKTQILKDSKDVKPNENLTYNWYSSNKLLETKGGFDGKLLHGYYKCFYLSDNLKESGEFDYGVKTGKWTSWYPNGVIREVITWKKGFKNGPYRLYNETGELVAEGHFKDDRLDGHFKTYMNGRLENKKKYRDGNEVIKPPKKERHKKEKAPRDKKQKVKFGQRVKNFFAKFKHKKNNASLTPEEKKQKPKKDKKKKGKTEPKPASITT